MNIKDSFLYIDVSYLVDISDNDISMMHELGELYSQQVSVLKESMEGCVAEKKFDDFKKVIHKAKSAALIMGVKPVIREIVKLEKKHITENDLDDLFKFIDFFSEISDKAIKEISLFLENVNKR